MFKIREEKKEGYTLQVTNNGVHSFLRKEKVQNMKDMFEEIWKTFSNGKVEVSDEPYGTWEL